MVEWMELEKFAVVQKTKNKKHVTENAYSITQAGLVPTKSFFKEKTNITSDNTSGYYIVEKDWFVYSPSRIDVGSISYLKDEGPVIVSPIDVVFSIDTTRCLPSYLLNYFFTHEGKKALLKNREGVEGMGRRNLPFNAIKTILIPIPSLSEQRRIVEILDTFSAAIENLKQQIAERKKQYEYYRNNLFKFKEGECEWKKLGEICTQFNGLSGASNKWKDIGNCRFIDYMNAYKNISIDVTNLPYATVQNIEKQIELRKGDVLFTAASETPDECALSAAIESDLPKGVFMDDHLFGIRINDDSKENVLPGYLKYLFRSSGIRSEINKSVRGVTRFYISKKDFMSLSIPIPPMEIQSRIASILDTFEAAIANLEAQLKEREKQYEYYRNKLLTFE